MNWYRFFPSDQYRNNWVLYAQESGGVPIHVRTRYLQMRCPQCGKVDEDRALRSGVDQDVHIRAQSDFVGTDDNLLCMSAEARRAVEENDIRGFEFISLPGDRAYSIALPVVWAHTDRQKLRMEFHRQCPVCRRYRQTCIWPFVSAMATPSDPLTVFTSEVPLENRFGRARDIFWASDNVVAIFQKLTLSGMDWWEAE